MAEESARQAGWMLAGLCRRGGRRRAVYRDIAMRFVAGGDLRSVMHREGPLPP